MTADAPDLGGLSLMLDGYFHEDFRAEHGGHEGAARAFVRDASGEERSDAAAALDQLLAWATGVPRARWQEALGSSGTVGAVSQLLAASGASDPEVSASARLFLGLLYRELGALDRAQIETDRAERRLRRAASVADLRRRMLATVPDLVDDPLRPGEIPVADPFLTPQGTVRTTPADLDLGDPSMSGMDGFFAARFVRGT